MRFDFAAPRYTPADSAPRTPLARCIRADAAPGARALVAARRDLVDTDIAIRLLLPGDEARECVAAPLAAALVQGSLGCARVLLEYGADVRASAFGYTSTVVFAAAHGIGEILRELVARAPELVGEALEVAVRRGRVGAVEVLLGMGEVDEGVWEVLSECREGKEGEYEMIVQMVGRKLGKKI